MMKRQCAALCLALSIVAALCICPATAAGDFLTNFEMVSTDREGYPDYYYYRQIIYGTQAHAVTNQSKIQITDIQGSGSIFHEDDHDNAVFTYKIQNPTQQTDRTLAAFIFYSPEQTQTILREGQPNPYIYCGRNQFETDAPYLAQIQFFDLTLAPGEAVTTKICSLFRSEFYTLDTPCLMIRFDDSQEMAEFEQEFDFMALRAKNGPNVYEMYLEPSKENAQFLVELGEMVLPDSLDNTIVDAGAFFEGLALVKYADGSEGFINTDGDIVIPAGQYAYARPFHEGKAVVARSEGKIFDGTGVYTLGFIDRVGNFTELEQQGWEMEAVFRNSFEPYFNESYLFVSTFSRGPGTLFDSQGHVVTKWAAGPVKGSVLRRYTDYDWDGFGGEHFYQMPAMTEILLPEDDGITRHAGTWEIYNVSNFDQGLAFAMVSNDIPGLTDDDTRVGGFIDTSGKMVIEPRYRAIAPLDPNGSYQVFSSGIACVLGTNGMAGGIDNSGNTVIPFEYEQPFYFGGDGELARVDIDGKAGYIDRNNNLVLPAIYDLEHSALHSNDGLVRVVKDGKAGYLDTTGKEVLPFVYDLDSTDFREGYAILVQDGVFTATPNPIDF